MSKFDFSRPLNNAGRIIEGNSVEGQSFTAAQAAFETGLQYVATRMNAIADRVPRGFVGGVSRIADLCAAGEKPSVKALHVEVTGPVLGGGMSGVSRARPYTLN